METPKNTHQHIRTIRNHTPKLSERKKKLFGSAQENEFADEKEELLNGISPLVKIKPRNGSKSPKSSEVMDSCIKSPRIMSFFESESEDGDTGEDQKVSPSRRSTRLSLKKSNNRMSGTELSTSPHKENIPIKTPILKESQETKQLQKMFSNSMQITPRAKSSAVNEDTSSDDDEMVRKDSGTIKSMKRQCEIEDSDGASPMRKVAKTTIPSMAAVSISTKSFYSRKQTVACYLPVRPSCRNLFGEPLTGNSAAPIKSRPTPRRSLGLQSSSFNRGVHHKVRKRANTLTSLSNRHYTTIDVDRILNNVRNEKLRKLIIERREEKQQIEKIHSIFRKASNPIALAKPLSSISSQDYSNNNSPENTENQVKHLGITQTTCQDDTDFSDIECGVQDGDDCEQADLEDAAMSMNEEVIPLITYQSDDALSMKSECSSTPVKKKFFKSGRASFTRKEVHLTDNIKATVTANGKLAIVSEKKKVKKRIKIRNVGNNEFSDEQAAVDAIVRNLDDTAFCDVTLPKGDNSEDNQKLNANDNFPFFNEITHQISLMNEEESSNNIVPQNSEVFNEFRKRLPFNTMDPEIIERQHLLLEFLITNNICTEENFNIFIADPDNHKAEAERVIDELVIVVTDHQNTDFRQRIPYNTTIPEIIEQQHNFLDFLLANNICTEENFDIFIANYNQRKTEANAILSQYVGTLGEQYSENTIELINNYDESNLPTLESASLRTTKQTTSSNTNHKITLPGHSLQTPLAITTAPNAPTDVSPNSSTANSSQMESQNSSEPQQKLFPVFYPSGCQPLLLPLTRRKQQVRLWNAGYGSNQYQIDAGQKEFGAHQCKQCGLVYTAHEPEEEKLHRDFHASLHILRFKGWIDEDIVAIFPEWGPDGRVIRLTESSPPKRRERLTDILKIVDKELGFSSYIVPKTFVAYFAVRKMQIVGLCLVQPLDKANKYICVNSVDCCTEEQFEAKCGISRIWVSPLHRRCHIGSKLIQAVQLNTIFGEEVPLNKIAFSAPTELGKEFAQKLAKTQNFLVYQ